ncbi:hypothetical protein LguiA_009135 [Lonicera macranthoides]
MTALSDKLESQQERKPNYGSNNGRQDEVKERLKAPWFNLPPPPFLEEPLRYITASLKLQNKAEEITEGGEHTQSGARTPQQAR